MGDDIRTGSTPPKTKIFVGRLPEDAKPQELKALFERYGTVTECDILNRYGFVHMKTDEMASRAIENLNNAEFMGVQISVEQSTGKKSGRGRGFGPMMRGRGGPMRGMGMGRAPPPYMMRDGRGDYDRRGPGMDGRGPGMDRLGLPPPPSMRNGYYDSYDRGYDGYYTARGPPPPPPILGTRDREPERRTYPDVLRDPYERRSFSDIGRVPYERPIPPSPAFERRTDYPARVTPDIYRRRSPPPPAAYAGAPTGYPAPSPLDRDMPPRRF